MSAWTAKYDADQRAAIARAYCELRVRPVAKIPRMAAAGELVAEAGAEPLPPFEIPYSSVLHIGRAAERRRNGELPAHLANRPVRDRVEYLQRELTSVVERDIARLQEQQRRRPKTPIDAEHARKLARALHELATLPDAHDRRLPRTPGEKGAATHVTKDSLAGKLLAASDASVRPSTRAGTPSATTQGDNADAQHTPRRHDDDDAHQQPHDDDAPCSDDHSPADELAASGVLVSAAG
ncbi:MAG TPA: hypothetical protein VGN13_05450 [Solirubrobacteraceae bacterium]|jgi:hypothetical protein